jgi:hypothetical protein
MILTTRRETNRSLSNGVVVDASVVARLLGLKLLRVKAHVTLTPAGLEPITYVNARAAQSQPSQHQGSSCLRDAVNLLAHASRTMNDAKRITS